MNWNIKLKTKNYKDGLLNFSMKHQNTKIMKKLESLRLKIWLEVEKQCNPKKYLLLFAKIYKFVQLLDVSNIDVAHNNKTFHY
jgi:hypothetical protein